MVEQISRAIAFAACAVLCLLHSACVSSTVAEKKPAAVSPAASTTEQRFVPYIPGVSTAREVNWLAPSSVTEDYTFPEKECRQKFTIHRGGSMIWHLEFAPSGPSHGAIVFRKTNDFSQTFGVSRIRLRIKPGTAAAQLRAGLVDGSGVLTKLAVAAPEAKADADWLLVELPLGSFPREGISPAGSSAGSGATFDWSAVREFRLIADGRTLGPVAINELRVWKETP